MYTSIAIANFFDKFQQQFSAYNPVGALYSPEMDFSKLKPYILNTQTKLGRNEAWIGIIFDRQTAQPGQLVYRSFPIHEEWVDPDTGKIETYKCANSSCEVNFNIVSNEMEHLEALENELRWFYNGWYEYTIDLNKLPEFKLAVGNITYGDFTKYKSTEYGQLCSLGMACTLNYPILLKGSSLPLIKHIHYYLARKMPNNVFYHADIDYNPDGAPIVTEVPIA